NTPVSPVGLNTTYITRFSEPLTVVMVSHFLIDLHQANERMMCQVSFLSSDVMSRLETTESIVFNRRSDGTDTSGATTDEYDMDIRNRYSVRR
ncbi:hypothetical protein BD309DRAFT_874935, partial [Dichomitus squalens]